jgi:hypothetical protein
VWFLYALFLDGQKQTPLRVACAGVIAGVAVVFNTDSGTFLLVAFLVYCAWRVGGAAGARRRAAAEVAAAWAALLAAGFALLFGASRGTIVTEPGAFLSGWLDGLIGYAGSGAGSLVFLSRVNLGDIALLMLIVAIYLGTVGRAVLRAMSGQLDGPGVVLACASLYGLARLIVFFQRTLPNNLYHTAVPAIAVVGLAAGPWLQAWMARGRPWRPFPPLPVVRGAIGAAVLMVAAVLLWTSPVFRAYPSVLRVAIKGAPAAGVELLPGLGVSGLPEDLRAHTAQARAGVEALRTLNAQGARVAVVDHRSTLYYLASGIAPWRGDSSLFYNTFTMDQQRALVADLATADLDYVFIREGPPQSYFIDTWRACKEAVAGRYRLDGRAGLFEIWKRS